MSDQPQQAPPESQQAQQAPPPPPEQAPQQQPPQAAANDDDDDAGATAGSPASSSAAPPARGAPMFGRERFLLLRQKWLTPNPNVAPRPVPPDPMDEDDIIDAVTGCPGDVLDPPVHLPFMAEALSIMWEEDGLYN
uniref:Uncharacterized protein n=1 Tax=Neobodo designis TaxID=312471 RepID=A0A7S1L4W1_NEODS|mmetsp:Transcript_14923/g.46252  ORF Transcript_14923/g.46252 Transcript_14923/m.46252 type:complete len:136 (+) Transcript_14923:80-487(+)